MTSTNQLPLDPLIEGYLSYLDKVGRKTPRTIIDVRCTLRRALSRLRTDVPLWRLPLEDYLHWLEAEREAGCTETSLAKYLSHLRGFLDYAWRSGRSERNVLDGFATKHRLAADRAEVSHARRSREIGPCSISNRTGNAAGQAGCSAALRMRTAHRRALLARCGSDQPGTSRAACAPRQGRQASFDSHP